MDNRATAIRPAKCTTTLKSLLPPIAQLVGQSYKQKPKLAHKHPCSTIYSHHKLPTIKITTQEPEKITDAYPLYIQTPPSSTQSKKSNSIYSCSTSPYNRKASFTNEQFGKFIDNGIELADEIKRISHEYVQNNYAKKLSEYVDSQMVKIGYSNIEDILKEVNKQQSTNYLGDHTPSIDNSAVGASTPKLLTPFQSNENTPRVVRSSSFYNPPKKDDEFHSTTSKVCDSNLSSFNRAFVNSRRVRLEKLLKMATLKHSIKNEFLFSLATSNISKARRILDKNPSLVNDKYSVR